MNLRSDPLTNRLLDSVTAYFGGGTPKAPKQEPIQLPPAPNYSSIPAVPAMPKLPDPVVPDPPVSMSAAEIQQAKDQQKIDAGKRQGIRKTLIAGESNQPAASVVTGKTLLG
ncbi:MAG: hypothetical protein WCQ16_02860 [Verrucomicrobiae bacterium]